MFVCIDNGKSSHYNLNTYYAVAMAPEEVSEEYSTEDDWNT
jgi:hypothetical protein